MGPKIFSSIKERIPRHANLLIYILVSLLPLIYTLIFKAQCSWDTARSFYCGDFNVNLYNSLYSWDDKFNTGMSINFYNFTYFIYASFHYLLTLLQAKLPFLSLDFAQGAWLSILIFQFLFMADKLANLFSSKYLSKNLALKNKVVFSLSFLFNPLTIFYLYSQAYNTYLIIFLPLFLYSFFNFAFKSSPRNFLIFAAANFLFQIIYFNALFLLLYLFLFVFLLLIFKTKFKKLCLLLILAILLNLYWLLPLIFQFKFQLQDASVLVGSVTDHVKLVSEHINIMNLLFLLPVDKDYYFFILNSSFQKFISSPIYYFLIAVFLILAILLPLFKAKNRNFNRAYLFCLAIFLLAIFIAAGIYSPFGKVLIGVYSLAGPLFRAFSTLSLKFCFLQLLALQFIILHILIFNKSKRYLNSILITVIALGFLFWSGNLFRDKITINQEEYKSTLQIPEDYHSLKNELGENNFIYRIASLPLLPFNMVTYDWHGLKYLGLDFESTFLNRPVIQYSLPKRYFSFLLDSLYQAIESNEYGWSDQVITTLRILNTKKIIVHKDIFGQGNYLNRKIMPNQKINELEEKLETKQIATKIKETDNFTFYDLKNDFFLPQIFTARTVTLTNFDKNLLPKLGFLFAAKDRPFIYFYPKDHDVSADFPKDAAEYYLTLFDKSLLNTGETKNSVNLSELNVTPDKNFSLISFLGNPTVNLKYDQVGKGIKLIIPESILKINNQPINIPENELANFPVDSGQTLLKIGMKSFLLADDLDKQFELSEFGQGIEMFSLDKATDQALNLINDGSFETGLWHEKAGDCSNSLAGAPIVSMKLVADATDGKNSLALSSKNHFACASRSFSLNLNKENKYLLSFDYKNLKGDLARFYILIKGEKQNYSFDETWPIHDAKWHSYSKLIQPKENIKAIDLYFYAPSDGSMEIINLFDNVKLVELKLDQPQTVKTVDFERNQRIQDLNLTNQNEIEYAHNSKQTNLLNDGSFETGLWHEQAGDCSKSLKGQPNLSMSLVNDATEGENSLELKSSNHFACASKLFPVDLTGNKIYKLSFDYKNVTGEEVKYYYLLQGDTQSYSTDETIIAKDKNWHHFEKLIDPPENINAIEVYFYAPSDGSKEIINRFDNLKMEEWLPKDLFTYYFWAPAQTDIKTPVVEFKKINPTKYRVRVHGATDNFPLIFSESYHQGWRAYPVSNPEFFKTPVNLPGENYQIPDLNQEEAASQSEIIEFIKKGWLTGIDKALSNQPIKFISKNFQDTIQNDNLPNGHFHETFFKKSLANEKHLLANGFANAWWIETQELCQKQNFCRRNQDGSYDFEIILEFWPQRLFYIGLILTGLTIFSCYILLLRKK